MKEVLAPFFWQFSIMACFKIWNITSWQSSAISMSIISKCILIRILNEKVLNIELDSESDNEEEIKIIVNYFDVEEKINESNV